MAVHDAGQGQADAGFADAGFADAGLTDAGLTDAGLVDAGVGEGGDAGRLDAGALGVRVVGGGFERNGQPWRARGVSLVGLVGAPASLSKLGPYWQAAQTRLSSPTTRRALFSAFKAWGVDTLRFQVSQDGLDSNGAFFDSGYAPFVKTVVDDALAEGFVVIVSMRSEMPTFENACTAEQTAAGKPIDLPCSVTDRAWASLVTAGVTSHPDVMVEVFNEPLSGNTPNSAENWAVWKQAHQPRIDSLRAAGVASVLVADGVRSGKFAPPSPAAELDDPLSQLAYGIHPYPLLGPTLSYVTPADWEEAFGRSCTSNPCVITEWNSSSAQDECFDSGGVSTPVIVQQLFAFAAARDLGNVLWPGDAVGGLIRSLSDSGATLTAFGDPATFSCSAPGPIRGPGEMMRAYYLTGSTDIR